MRKKVLAGIAFIVCFTLFSQNIDDLEFTHTKDSLTSALLSEFDYLNSKTFKIKQKLDSIKIDKQIELISQLEGKWEFVKVVCQDCIISKAEEQTKKYIEITKKHIIFYKDAISEKHIVSKETLKFSDFIDSFSGLTTLVYKDKRAWNYTIDTTKTHVSASYIGNEKEGRIVTSVSGNYSYFYKRIE